MLWLLNLLLQVGLKSDRPGDIGVLSSSARFDAVIVTGATSSPVYLWIKDGQAELRDARKLMGLETLEVDRRIEAELGDPRVRVLRTGQAGKRMVRRLFCWI